MTVNSTTAWQSDLSPGTIFKTHEEATQFERVMVPRFLLQALLQTHVSVDSNDVAVIDKIVVALGELWNVQGYKKPDIGR